VAVTALERLWTVDVCRSCGASIIWAITDTGLRMPVDARSHEDGKLRLVYHRGDETPRVTYDTATSPHPKHRPHLATCPDADGWRKR
jgi:hypothetical protein